MENLIKVGFGGGCHWCTEAVFKSVAGVQNVQQGYIASTGDASDYSEAIVLAFNAEIISLNTLIEIHLRTHKSTSNHSFRTAYRSAVYCFNEKQISEVETIIENLQCKFEEELITKALPFQSFKESREDIRDYYFKNPEKPFCETYIDPKLNVLLKDFSKHISAEAKGILKSKLTKTAKTTKQ